MQYCGAESGGGSGDRGRRAIDDAPFAEAHETRRKMQAESLHEMSMIAVDAMHRKRPQYKTYFRRGS